MAWRSATLFLLPKSSISELGAREFEKMTCQVIDFFKKRPKSIDFFQILAKFKYDFHRLTYCMIQITDNQHSHVSRAPTVFL